MQSDARPVEAVRADDHDALAALYDRFADPVHAFCHGRLRDDVAAADALRQTFVRARRRLGRLDDPAAVRPWLFAIARTTAAEIAAGRDVEPRPSWGPVGGRRSTSGVGTAAEPWAAPTPQETAALVAEAAAALAPRDQELFGLHLGGGLDGGELAVAMGIAHDDVDTMVAQMKDRLSAGVGPLLVARVGRGACDDLDDLLADWNGTYSRGIRSRVARHLEGCARCRRTCRTAIAWESLGAALSSPPAPAAVRSAVLGSSTRAHDHDDAPVATAVPEGSEGSEGPVDPGGPVDPVGPVTPESSGDPRRRLVPSRAAAVVLTTLIAGAAMLLWSMVGGDPDVVVLAEVAGVTENSTPNPNPPVSATTTPAPAPAPSPTAPPSAPAGTLPATPGPDPTTSDPTTPDPTAGVDPAIGPLFFGSTSPIEFPTATAMVTYTFANVGDTPMAWTATVSPPFVLDATAGSAPVGEAVTLTVGVDPAAAEALDGALVIGTDRGSFTIALRSVPPTP